jgi:hypothetical protein
MLTKTVLISTASLAILCGWFQLIRFSTTAGEQSPAPALLPADLLSVLMPAPIARAPLMLVFVHPQCSCTPATYAELDQLFESVNTPVDLVFAVYESAATARKRRVNSSRLLGHPYRLIVDANGALARRFHAATSGEVLLYSASRHLLFEGGITPSRAHCGDSPGSQTLLKALVSGRRDSAVGPTAVFGCPIFRLGHSG